jgi:hypothetical protein
MSGVYSVPESADTVGAQLRSTRFPGGPVFRVAVNHKNSDILVGGRNAIYRLSGKDLSLIESFTTGPVDDNIECLPPSDTSCDKPKARVDNDNRVLLVNGTVLLACGTAYQGMCYLFKADNISGFNKLYGPPNDTISFVASKASSVAFFAPSDVGKGDVLLVANAYDGRPLHMSPPSVSSRRLNGFHSMFAHNFSH